MDQDGERLDPLGLMKQRIGPYQVGHPVRGISSGLLYVGYDITQRLEKSAWLQFFDAKRALQLDVIERQARAWSSFHNPIFAKTLGFEHLKPFPPFVAVEKVSGDFLGSRIASGRMSLPDTIKLIRKLAHGLDAAHRAGLVHLGLSEESIVVGGGHATVIGFGLSTGFEADDLLVWHYLAPEQIAAQTDCDERADIYALGVLLYRCLTQQFPIEPRAGQSLPSALAVGERRALSDLMDEPPEALVRVVHRATEKDRARRYGRITELLSDIRELEAIPSLVVPADSHRQSTPVFAPPRSEPRRSAGVEESTLSPDARDAPGPARAAAAPEAKTFSPEASVATRATLESFPVLPPPERDAGPRSTPLLDDSEAKPVERGTPILDEASAGAAPVAELAPLQTPSPDSLAGVEMNGFRFERKLGQGGMGVVYLAKNIKRSSRVVRSCAVKIAIVGMSARAEQRFAQEYDVMNALKEGQVPRVIEVYQHGRLDNGLPFFEMELIRGKSLDQVIRETGALPIIRALKITDSISDTVEKAHNLSICHRDLKSSNVMCEEIPGDRRTHLVRVLDWGIARVTGEIKQLITDVDKPGGTPPYAAPETLEDAKGIDGRADVYSLGVMLFEMITGRLPFIENEKQSLIQQTFKQPPPLASSLREGVPAELDALINAAMTKEFEARPTMARFRAELLTVLNKIEERSGGGQVVTPHLTMRSTAEPVHLSLHHKPTEAVPLTGDRKAFHDQALERPVLRSPATFLFWIGGLALLVGIVAGIAWWAHREKAGPAMLPARPVESAPAAIPVSPPRAADTKPTGAGSTPATTAPVEERSQNSVVLPANEIPAPQSTTKHKGGPRTKEKKHKDANSETLNPFGE